MPYIVIYVDKQEDVDTIIFNDEQGNTQYVGNITDETIGFHVEAVVDNWPVDKQ